MKLLVAYIFASIIYISMSDNNNPETDQSDNQSRKLFSFGVVSDVQYSDFPPAGTRFYRSSTGKLREAMSSFKTDAVDFVINLGDLIDKDFGSYKPITDILDSSGLKIFHVAGNHDFSVEPEFKKRLPVLTPEKNGYYSFVKNNFRFICLNGNELSTYISNNRREIKKAQKNLAEMVASGEVNAVDWNGGISDKQIIWLRKKLDDAVAAGEKVILICHFPVLPENVHNLLNYKEILPLIENYKNIVAWFNGHNHAGNYDSLNNIHFVTFRGMVETEYDNSFASVDVFDNRLVINGFGREKSRTLMY
jgi:predicted phosphodiesterase